MLHVQSTTLVQIVSETKSCLGFIFLVVFQKKVGICIDIIKLLMNESP